MYLERKKLVNAAGKAVYQYLVECPACHEQRWQWKTKATHCKSCAGRISYTLPNRERLDKRKYGHGYITKQGYHLLFDGEKYVPAHRLAFPDLPADHVVHHIDGDKLNNQLGNLLPLSKQAHRELHGQLEQVSYLLIQCGFIEFDRSSCMYRLSTSAQKCVEQFSVNSGELLPGGAGDNPEPSPNWGRCNDYPFEEYAQVGGSAERLTEKVEDEDIVCSAWKQAAVTCTDTRNGRGSNEPL